MYVYIHTCIYAISVWNLHQRVLGLVGLEWWKVGLEVSNSEQLAISTVPVNWGPRWGPLTGSYGAPLKGLGIDARKASS